MAFPESLDLDVEFNSSQRKLPIIELELKEQRALIEHQEERRRRMAEDRLGEPVVFVRGIGYVAASTSLNIAAEVQEPLQ